MHKHLFILIGFIVLCAQSALSLSDDEIIIRKGKVSEKSASGIVKPDCTAPEVKLKQGRICGKREVMPDGKAFYSYLGIPYAETTSGQNRWRPPVPHKEWKGVLKATAFGDSCPQSYFFDFKNPESEDCLKINVWTPEVNPKNPRAVMVFIYGGYFLRGFSGDPLYDASFISAAGDVVVVTFNYRLGALGFLAGIKDKKAGEEINGNFGLQDQILALKWVRDNIESFGGDPDKVTVFGESSGAMSVAIHLTASPESEQLFRAAILESDPFGIPYKTLNASQTLAHSFAKRLGCRGDDISCLREKSFAEVVEAQKPRGEMFKIALHGMVDMVLWSPVIDGKIFIAQPIDVIRKHKITKPVILGTNKNEALIFVELSKKKMNIKSLSDLDYHLLVDLIFRDHELVDEIYKRHPSEGRDNTRNASKLLTEYLFLCPNFFMARNSSPDKTWVYLFDHVSSFDIWADSGIVSCPDAVCHGDELPFVFGTAEMVGFDFTGEESQLSGTMLQYWTNFAKNLNPNGSGPDWPQFQSHGSNVILVTPINKIEHVSDLDDHCLFWDKVGYNLHYSLWDLF